jgi:hypothetical protein
MTEAFTSEKRTLEKTAHELLGPLRWVRPITTYPDEPLDTEKLTLSDAIEIAVALFLPFLPIPHRGPQMDYSPLMDSSIRKVVYQCATQCKSFFKSDLEIESWKEIKQRGNASHVVFD